MAEVIWAGPALREFARLMEFIALDKPEAAKSVARNIETKVQHLSEFPRLGKKVPELAKTDYRMLWCDPCRVYYRVETDRVIVLHIERTERLFSAGDMLGE